MYLSICLYLYEETLQGCPSTRKVGKYLKNTLGYQKWMAEDGWEPEFTGVLFIYEPCANIHFLKNMKISHLTQATPCPLFAATLPSRPPAPSVTGTSPPGGPQPAPPPIPAPRSSPSGGRPGAPHVPGLGEQSPQEGGLPASSSVGADCFMSPVSPAPHQNSAGPQPGKRLRSKLAYTELPPRPEQKGCH